MTGKQERAVTGSYPALSFVLKAAYAVIYLYEATTKPYLGMDTMGGCSSCRHETYSYGKFVSTRGALSNTLRWGKCMCSTGAHWDSMLVIHSVWPVDNGIAECKKREMEDYLVTILLRTPPCSRITKSKNEHG